MFKLSDPISPTLVFDEEDEQALFVLMPMRVQSILKQMNFNFCYKL